MWIQLLIGCKKYQYFTLCYYIYQQFIIKEYRRCSLFTTCLYANFTLNCLPIFGLHLRIRPLIGSIHEQNVEFSRSSARQQRLKRLVSMGHEWELRVGFDAPLMMTQQHSFALTKGSRGTREERLHASAQWLVDTGIDFLQTQQGTTEVRCNSRDDVMPPSWVACV
jgi:hypothetical protein